MSVMSAKGRRHKPSLCLPAATTKMQTKLGKLSVFQGNIAHNQVIHLHREYEHKKDRFCWDFISFKRKSDSTAFKICRSKLFHLSATFWVSWKGRKKSVWRLFPWRQGTERLKMICSWAQVKAERMHVIKAAITCTECLKFRYPGIPSHRRYALRIHLSLKSRKTGKICCKALRVGFWPYCDRKNCGNFLTQLLDCNPHN